MSLVKSKKKTVFRWPNSPALVLCLAWGDSHSDTGRTSLRSIRVLSVKLDTPGRTFWTPARPLSVLAGQVRALSGTTQPFWGDSQAGLSGQERAGLSGPGSFPLNLPCSLLLASTASAAGLSGHFQARLSGCVMQPLKWLLFPAPI